MRVEFVSNRLGSAQGFTATYTAISVDEGIKLFTNKKPKPPTCIYYYAETDPGFYDKGGPSVFLKM